MSTALARKRFYDRHLQARPHDAIGKDTRRLIIPDDIERLESHEPCRLCGVARGGCKHRPWMLAAGVP